METNYSIRFFFAYQQDAIHCVASDHLLPHTESEDLEPRGDGFVAELMLMVTFVGPFGLFGSSIIAILMRWEVLGCEGI